CQQNDKSPLTF
nr:immunoglobulin light chain junction region [Macaca mulatta]MOV74222.1 immunoglobulin light chain junction region [Macaca mulatta]MOV74233.1 immunoglobulin light chain junction region [Macaca mulatta]MOV74239.1 immunoglobulin light chain junction region [Macaca mulatta]MOV74330.1 immunoglobulin light chain junction region [Macaca mulatta]